MTSLWPWLAVAGIGALHGLNPATGWGLAAAWGLRSRSRTQALRALLPIAAGHAASVLLVAALVAASVETGVTLEPIALQVLAAVLLLFTVIHLLRHRKARPAGAQGAPAAHAGLALWSFIMSTTHGAGLMLVPSLIPLCMGEGAVREITASGSLALGLAAVGVHMAAMLAVTGALAAGTCRLWSASR